MLFEELGAALRELREGKGLSLEEVSRYIKIPERTLTDIEEGNLDALPRTVYTKGFIRTYSKFMGMPTADINKALEEHFPSEQENVKTVMSPVFTGKVKTSRKSTLFLLILLGVLAVGAWYTYSYVLKNSSVPPAAPAIFHNESSISAIANSNHLPNVATGNSSSASTPLGKGPISGASSIGASSGRMATSNTTSSKNATAPLQHNASAAVQSADAGVYYNRQNSSNSTSKKHIIVVTAMAECWIKATTDVGDERPFNLPKNQSSVFTFNKFLKLRLGNVAGVKIRYDGEDFSIPSGDGNTRDITFPPSR